MDVKFLINSLGGGGAERVLVRLLPYLPIKQVILLEKDIEYDIPKNKLLFLSEHSLKTNPILKTLYIPFYALELLKYVSSSTIIISFLERANFVNIVASLLSKHKTIISVRMEQTTGRKGLRKLNFLLIKLLYHKAHFVIAVSQGVKDSLIKLGVPEDKIKVIYNPYPLEEIKVKAKEEVETIFENIPYIITVGRLTQPKGQWYLLRIFKKLKDHFPNLRLLVFGKGELKDYLVKLSEELGLKTFVWDRDKISDNFDVYFLGFQKNPFKYVSRAKLFVFSSLWEGFPNALVEAMACGVPVISTDCKSGPREILAPDTDYRKIAESVEFAKYGVLVPPLEVKYKMADEPLEKGEQILYEAIKTLLENEEIRRKYASLGLERAKDFDIDKITKEWKALLEGLM